MKKTNKIFKKFIKISKNDTKFLFKQTPLKQILQSIEVMKSKNMALTFFHTLTPNTPKT